MAHSGDKVGFRKVGEDGVSSLASRLTEGIYVDHHGGTAAVSCVTKNGSCAGQKMDETATERCMGSHELGCLVWHAAANGGS